MNEKYNNWLKRIGIAGFLFFLIKGILWLLFGTAIYKWFQNLFLTSLLSLIPLFVICQYNPTLNTYPNIAISISKIPAIPSLTINRQNTKPLFCRLEDQLNSKKKYPIKFRLGSLDYTNKLEYSSDLIHFKSIINTLD
ncbi:MAG: hypothetical protein IPO78_08230 [Saprospiraceae bacterium]|nr:hypothetical protein [Saprospiraceae bacterium]MBK9721596.1 hypothetical protein [Saprospiraceae bacterium]